MRFFSKIPSLLEMLFLSRDERNAFKKIKDISQSISTLPPEFTVIVDGIISFKPLTLYFVLLLLSIKCHAKCNIRTVVLTSKSRHKFFAANRLYKAVGETIFHSFEDSLSDAEESQLESQYQLIIAHINSPDDLLNLIIEGVPFGKNIYGSYIRHRLIGTVQEIDLSVKDAVRVGLRNYFVAKKLLYTYSPNLVMLSHSEYDTFGALFYRALEKEVPVAISHPSSGGKCVGKIYTKLDQFVGVNRNYVYSLTSETWDRLVEQYGEAERRITEEYLSKRFAGKDNSFNGDYHENTTRLSPQSIRTQLGINEHCKKVVLIATHLLWDDATGSYQALYRDYEIWLAETLKVIKSAQETSWIVKAHPSEQHMGTNRKVSDIFNEIYAGSPPKNVVFIDADSDINTYSLIDASDAVLTVRGTIGFEAACKGKQVINAGTGPYSGLGFNVEFKTQEEYENYLLQLSNVNTELTDHQVEMAKIATYGYLIYKHQLSQILSKRNLLRDYVSLSEDEIVNDDTLKRFALQLHSGLPGDIL